MRICFAVVFCCFFVVFVVFVFFPSTKTMRQPFSGTAERIVMKLSPNDGGKCSLKCRAAAWRKSCRRLANSEWRMLMLCVIYDMTLAESPEGATGGCVIQQ